MYNDCLASVLSLTGWVILDDAKLLQYKLTMIYLQGETLFQEYIKTYMGCFTQIDMSDKKMYRVTSTIHNSTFLCHFPLDEFHDRQRLGFVLHL